MWEKPLVIFFLFYLFALLQNSFFTHFNLFGAIPNLVFILFFFLVFIENPKVNFDKYYYIIFFAFVAGIFLDIYSYTYIGPSITIFLLVGFLLKKTQLLLKSRENNCPFIYFLPLFIIFLAIYNLSSGLYTQFFETNKITMLSGWLLVFSLIYNSIIASAFFYLYKKWQKSTR